MATKYDYDKLKREYITAEPEISVRELCRRHDIKSWSTVNARKNSEDWDEQRTKYQAGVEERQVEVLVSGRLREIAEIHGELLLAIRAGVRKYIAGVSADGNQDVSARDLMGLIDKFLLLSGSTPHRTENRNLDAHSFSFDGLLADAPPELLRELAELAGKRGSASRSMGRGPLVVLEGTG